MVTSDDELNGAELGGGEPDDGERDRRFEAMRRVPAAVIVMVAVLVVAPAVGVTGLAAATDVGTEIGDPAADRASSTGGGPAGVAGGGIDLGDADTLIVGDERADYAGWSVAGVGDVNGDGHDDLLVGAPSADTSEKNGGAAYLFYGPVDADEIDVSEADHTFTAPDENDVAGWAVAGGDLDGDEYSDLIIGVPSDDAEATDAGAAYVVYGGSDIEDGSLPNVADVRLTGEEKRDRAGFAVDVLSAGDGEGGAAVVGAPAADPAGNASGSVYVVDLRDGPEETSISLADADATFHGEDREHVAGWAVAAGDVTDDDRSDLIVGAPGSDAEGTDAGTAYVVSDALDADGERSLADATARFAGEARGDKAGWAVAVAGDVNGDGAGDVVVGAPHNDEAGRNAGAAYVVHGGDFDDESRADASLADADRTLLGERRGDLAGFAVAGVDDSCDEYAAVLVGAPHHDSEAGLLAGAAYLVTGDDDGRTVDLADATATFLGDDSVDRAGFAVADVGDVTDDDVRDIAIGAPFADDGDRDAGETAVVPGDCETADGEDEDDEDDERDD
ncbi:integrin alpha [Halobaculum magnesiiphilum]|uniref:Integrin alpha n=1 Tax=Halobaculum magnesiiphilum TaxID=1017351 RepID=A0A8T8WE27_9EURY|nr:integrin alpha [Halobaculum magnesiiphilum]QZP38122.1 integrin alpha [Halobaculum magnesiiphilum]